MPDIKPLTLEADGNSLEAEVARPVGAPNVGVVLCHPHPQYGGTMRSIVISALFAALPDQGAAVLRFNFRGVEGSTGTYDGGRGERTDATVALHTLADLVPAGTPLVLVGWSFGGDVALSVLDPAITAWVGIAPPLRFVANLSAFAADPRPKLLVLAAHDEVRAPADVAAEASTWSGVEIEIVPGASHFFVGRTDQLTAAVSQFVRQVATGS